MKKRLLALLTILLLVFSTLYACAPAKETKETNGSTSTKVVLNEVAHSIFYAPMYVAIEEGYFTAEGIDVDLVTGFGVL